MEVLGHYLELFGIFFRTLRYISWNALANSLFHSVRFISHTVKYISHTVKYISHTVVFVSHSVKQRICWRVFLYIRVC